MMYSAFVVANWEAIIRSIIIIIIYYYAKRQHINIKKLTHNS